MTVRKILIFLCLLWSLTVSLISQEDNISFSQVESVNGVAISKINAITQDEKGYLWLADPNNRCVIRYDGSHMQKYEYSPNNEFSLGGYYPETLLAEGAGILWIGYFGQGLDKFNTETGEIKHWEHEPNNGYSLANNHVTSLTLDHEGNLWVGHYGGLSMFDPKTDGFINYTHNPDDVNSLSSKYVRKLFTDHEGTIWVGCGNPWELDGDGGLNRFDKSTGAFTRYLHDPSNQRSLINNKVTAIFEDSQGSFWVGTMEDGLHTFDKTTGLFTRHLYDPKYPAKLSRSALAGDYDIITFITEDSENQIWIGSLRNGLIRFNPKTQTGKHYGEHGFPNNPFAANSSWAHLALNEGLLFVSTQDNRLFKIDISPSLIPHSDEIAGIFDIESNNNELWFSTWNGLFIKNLLDGSIRHQPIDIAGESGLDEERIEEIFLDSRGNFWLCTYRGIIHFNSSTQKFTLPTSKQSQALTPADNHTYGITEDSQGNIWVLNSKGEFNRIDPITLEVDLMNSITEVGSIKVIFMESDDQILFGGYSNRGLSRFQISTGEVENLIDNLSIFCIYSDETGIIWVGTSNGLFSSDSVGYFQPFKKEEVSILSQAPIFSIIEDEQKNLWMGSTEKVLILNDQRDQIKVFDKSNGILDYNENHLIAASRDKNNIIYFNSSNGYYSLDPTKLKTIDKDLTIRIERFFHVQGSVKTAYLLDQENLQLNQEMINLSYLENTFEVEYSVIDYRKSEGTEVQYRLENFDESWRSASDLTISYYKVPPGNYQLMIRVLNNSTGIWNQRKVAIYISKPWWKTWWAYVLYMLSAVLILYLLYLEKQRKIIKKERSIAKEKELTQAREIERAFKELKATQAQLIQSEKMASLGELTAGIAHEIQNPLNFVNNFSEISSELLDEMKEEIEKGNYNDANDIADDVIENLEKINHHGKRADAIVKGMLQHSRPESGQKELTDLNALADEYLRLAYHGLRAKDKSFNAQMKTNFDPDMGLVKVIPQAISRVLLNLCTNAFYAVNERNKQGHSSYNPEVTVATVKSAEKIEIIVSDNGSGIPPDVRDKIFQPFFTTKPAGQGTGLGLSLSYDIITKGHDGNIAVESEVDRGTKFTITLNIS